METETFFYLRRFIAFKNVVHFPNFLLAANVRGSMVKNKNRKGIPKKAKTTEK